MKFFKVFDALSGRTELGLLSFLGLEKRVRGAVVGDVVLVLL